MSTPVEPLPEGYYADDGALRAGCRITVTVPAAAGERWQVDVDAPERYGSELLVSYPMESVAGALWVVEREARGEDAGPQALARWRRAQSLGSNTI